MELVSLMEQSVIYNGWLRAQPLVEGLQSLEAVRPMVDSSASPADVLNAAWLAYFGGI